VVAQLISAALKSPNFNSALDILIRFLCGPSVYFCGLLVERTIKRRESIDTHRTAEDSF